MKAHLDNRSMFPLQQVRSAVRWTLDELDANLPIVGVRIKETRHLTHTGRFYGDAERYWPEIWADIVNGSKTPRLVRHLIVGRVPRWPMGFHDRGFKTGPPAIDPKHWKESLICIVAHEATHVMQYIHSRPLSEVQAEWAEFRLLRRWRDR